MNKKEIIKKLYKTNRSFVTDDYDYCLNYIDENILPLQIHKFPSDSQIWDSWIIPKKWIVNHAFVKKDGKEILNYDDHPLHLIGCSAPYKGYVDKEKLKSHLHFHHNLSNAIPWHFRLNYRPWDSDWGFCVTEDFYNDLDDGEYYVEIDTEFEDDFLKVAEYHLAGEKDETIVFIAHLDHTGMANDDLSGVVVGLEVMEKLKKMNNRTFSYKLLLVQEMLGSAAYLSREYNEDSNFKYGIFLEMLGNENRIALQKSFEKETKIDKIAEYVLKESEREYEINDFRENINNDEIIFESPGYEIPTISLNRYPYQEYHSHLDNPDIIEESVLNESVDHIMKIINILENDFIPKRKFKGLPSLANPKYDLYIDPGQEALEGNLQDKADLNKFRDYIFRYLEGEHSIFEISYLFNLKFEFVYSYLKEFEEKGLIEVK
ncbi:MAG: DUF4910 domain-containing protein [Bacillota bacterium]